MTAIYRLAEHPDQVCGDIIKQIAAVIVKGGQRSDEDNQSEESEGGKGENGLETKYFVQKL